MYDLNNIKLELENLHGEPISESMWEYLDIKGYINEVANGTKTLNDLEEIIQEIQVATGLRNKPKDRLLYPLNRVEILPNVDRVSALSVAIATIASKSNPVINFRANELNKKIIDASQIEKWISSQKAKQNSSKFISSFEIPNSHKPIQNKDGSYKISPPLHITKVEGVEEKYLYYLDKKLVNIKKISVIKDSLLDKLRKLSIQISEEFSWDKSESTMFILTDYIPRIYPVNSKYIKNNNFKGLSKIHMEIDPTTSPKDVMVKYSEFRREFIQGRHRDLSIKHLNLAIFYAKKNKNEKWIQSMYSWNSNYGNSKPSWKYEVVTNFALHCKRAFEKLVSPNLNQI
tara:strand:+ start:20823 stop:21854 length:1032 start_codon:yes stop_codon:yes gene_type:complete